MRRDRRIDQGRGLLLRHGGLIGRGRRLVLTLYRPRCRALERGCLSSATPRPPDSSCDASGPRGTRQGLVEQLFRPALPPAGAPSSAAGRNLLLRLQHARDGSVPHRSLKGEHRARTPRDQRSRRRSEAPNLACQHAVGQMALDLGRWVGDPGAQHSKTSLVDMTLGERYSAQRTTVSNASQARAAVRGERLTRLSVRGFRGPRAHEKAGSGRVQAAAGHGSRRPPGVPQRNACRNGQAACSAPLLGLGEAEGRRR